MERRFGVEGMHCGSCVAKVTAALRGVEGVESAEVGLSPPSARVVAGDGVEFGDLAAAVRGAGYRLTEPTSNDGDDGPGESDGREHRHGAVSTEAGDLAAGSASKESLYPLVLIVALITGATVVTNATRGGWSWGSWMADFMGGFFLVFGGFKLLDLPGFVTAYRRYDLVAARVPAWGWAYPFVELGLAAMFLGRWMPMAASIATLALMLVGAAGVLLALRAKTKIRCACLGTALNLPMTTVTLVEDLAMAAMAGAMLVV